MARAEVWRPATAASPTDPGRVGFEGVVLCGGRSSRMGRDKALLPVDGVPMARRVADALLTAGAVRVVAQGGDVRALARLGMSARPDADPGAGPLAAVIDALSMAQSDLVAILGCDLLAPDASSIASVVGALDCDQRVEVAVPLVGGVRQWHHAAWRRSALGPLRDARAGGIGSLRRAVDGSGVREVAGIPPSAIADADEPADLP